MKVIRIQDVPAEPVEGGIFIGGEVSRQPLVTEDMGPYFSMTNVSFGPAPGTSSTPTAATRCCLSPRAPAS